MKRRVALRGIGTLALSLGAANIASGAEILAVRVWPADDYTRVTVESASGEARDVVLHAASARGVALLGGTS